jgi:hypothetical protein
MPPVNSDSTIVDDGPVDVATIDSALDNFSLDDIILNMSKSEESPVDIPDLSPKEEKEEVPEEVEPEVKVEAEETVDEADKADEPEEEKTVAQIALETLGLESLNPSEYPDSIEGIVTLVKDTSQALAKDAIDKTLSVNPILKDFHDFVHNGGDPRAFLNATFPSDDYLSLEVTEDNTPLQKHLISIDLERRGLGPDEIKAEIADHEKAGGLYRWSLRSLKGLRENQSVQKEQLVKEQEIIAAEEKQSVVDYWSSLKDTLKDNNAFLGITVPESQKDSLFAYMSVPVQKDGKTQLLVDSESMTPEEEIAVYWVVKNRDKLADLLLPKAKTKMAESLSQTLRNGGRRVLASQPDFKPKSASEVSSALDTLDFLSINN